MAKPILHIHNLHVASSEKTILKAISLQIFPGKVYAIMGPNGAGKSTLAATLAGKPGYSITQGQALFIQKNLLTLNPQQRAVAGLFVAFQQPISIPGVSIINFLKTAVNQTRIAKKQPPLNALELVNLVKEKVKLLNMDTSILQKSLNENFSGGEKKLNELLQMAVLNPKLAILDEIDSGLDLDTIRLLGNTLQKMKKPDNALIIITHYPRLFEYIKPDVVHILEQGSLVRSGDTSLAHQLLKTGYKGICKTPLDN